MPKSDNNDLIEQALAVEIDTLEIDSGTNIINEITLTEYICERCGYHYKKATDFAPFLCYRCMRFIAKKVFTVMATIQPPTSRPAVGEV